MNSLKQYWANKQASLLTDYVGSTWSPGLFKGESDNMKGLTTLGTMHGMAEEDLTIPSDALGLAPGIGKSRILRRARRVRKELGPEGSGNRARIFSDKVAPLTNIALLAAIGGVLGHAHNEHLTTRTGSVYDTTPMGKRHREISGTYRGAMLGAGAGAVLGLAGALAAALTRKRTKEEQADVEGSTAHAVLNHLVPGKGAYDWHKRLGASTYFED